MYTTGETYTSVTHFKKHGRAKNRI